MTQIVPPVDNSNTLGLYASFEQWVVTQDAYIAIANVHKNPLQRNEQGQYVHHGIRLAFQAFAISHQFKLMGQAAAEAAEAFKGMTTLFESFKDIDVKELGETIKAATRQRLEGKTKEPFEPQEHIDQPH